MSESNPKSPKAIDLDIKASWAEEIKDLALHISGEFNAISERLGELSQPVRQASEQLKFVTEQLGLALKPMEPIVSDLARSVAAANLIIAPIGSQLEEISKQAGRLLAPILQEVPNWGRTLAPAIEEALKGFQEFEIALSRKMATDRVFLVPFLHQMTVQELNERLCQSEDSALEFYAKLFSDRANLELLLNSWSENDIFNRRLSILRAAVNAHHRREFELSIPIFLVQIEGILSEWLLTEGHRKIKSKLQQNRKANRNTDGNDADSLDSLIGIDRFVDIICNEIFVQTRNPKEKERDQDYPRRHEILHGDNISYFKDQNASLRCLLLLDMLTKDPTHQPEEMR